MQENTCLRISIILVLLLVFASCGKPVVTNQIDTNNNLVYPRETVFNKNTCKFETKELQQFQIATCPNGDKPILNPGLNGNFSVSSSDLKNIKTKIQADCMNQKNIEVQNNQKSELENAQPESQTEGVKTEVISGKK